jgi:hypothetical protein
MSEGERDGPLLRGGRGDEEILGASVGEFVAGGGAMKAICCTPTDRFGTETKDCTVRATSFALNMTYTEAHALLKGLGRKDRKGMVFVDKLDGLTELAGRKITRIAIPSLPVRGKYGAINYNGYRTLEQVLRMPELRRGRYIVVTTRHALAYIGGYIHDANRPQPRAKVYRVYQIELPEVK